MRTTLHLTSPHSPRAHLPMLVVVGPDQAAALLCNHRSERLIERRLVLETVHAQHTRIISLLVARFADGNTEGQSRLGEVLHDGERCACRCERTCVTEKVGGVGESACRNIGGRTQKCRRDKRTRRYTTRFEPPSVKLFTSARTHTHTHMYMYISLNQTPLPKHTHTHTYTYTYLHLHTYSPTSPHIYMPKHTHTHTYTHSRSRTSIE
jgi:hypothetical protein